MAYDDFLVIGSGPAGQKAAIQAAKLGNKVGIIERKEVIGGVCIHAGTILSQPSDYDVPGRHCIDVLRFGGVRCRVGLPSKGLPFR